MRGNALRRDGQPAEAARMTKAVAATPVLQPAGAAREPQGSDRVPVLRSPSGLAPLPLLVAAVTLAFGWIVLPFYGPILWASIIALLFAPLYRRLSQRLRSPNLAALVTLLAVLLIVVLPLLLIAAALAREAGALYQRVQSGEWNPLLFFGTAFDALPAGVRGVLDRFALVDFAALQARLASVLSRGSEWIATQAVGIGQNTFEVATGLAITVYLAFFLIRDGDAVVRALRGAIPLAPAHGGCCSTLSVPLSAPRSEDSCWSVQSRAHWAGWRSGFSVCAEPCCGRSPWPSCPWCPWSEPQSSGCRWRCTWCSPARCGRDSAWRSGGWW